MAGSAPAKASLLDHDEMLRRLKSYLDIPYVTQNFYEPYLLAHAGRKNMTGRLIAAIITDALRSFRKFLGSSPEAGVTLGALTFDGGIAKIVNAMVDNGAVRADALRILSEKYEIKR